MRTTINIDDKIMEIAKSLASQSKKTIGQIISEWALQGFKGTLHSVDRGGFPVFSVPHDAGIITPDTIRTLLTDEDLSSRR